MVDYQTAFNNLNWLSVLLGAVVSMALGYVWYAKPVFGRTWQKAVGLTDKQVSNANVTKTMGVAFIKTIITVFVVSLFVYGSENVMEGVATGLVLGAGVAATTLGIMYVMSQRPRQLFYVDGGFEIVNFALIGGLLAALQ